MTRTDKYLPDLFPFAAEDDHDPDPEEDVEREEAEPDVHHDEGEEVGVGPAAVLHVPAVAPGADDLAGEPPGGGAVRRGDVLQALHQAARRPALPARPHPAGRTLEIKVNICFRCASILLCPEVSE